MARHSSSSSSRRRLPDSRMCVRTQRIKRLNLVVFYILVLMICSVTVVTALPHFTQLSIMEAELDEVHQQEQLANDRKDQQFREYIAIEQDPEYLETIARDRLDLYRPGEVIFRFSRD